MKGGALGTLTYNPYHTEVKSLHQPKQSTTEDEPQKGSILRQRPSVRFSWLTCEDHHKTDEYFANINHDFFDGRGFDFGFDFFPLPPRGGGGARQYSQQGSLRRPCEGQGGA